MSQQQDPKETLGEHDSIFDDEAESYDAQGLIDMYARWKRKSALWIWGLLAFLVVAVMVIVALETR